MVEGGTKKYACLSYHEIRAAVVVKWSVLLAHDREVLSSNPAAEKNYSRDPADLKFVHC